MLYYRYILWFYVSSTLTFSFSFIRIIIRIGLKFNQENYQKFERKNNYKKISIYKMYFYFYLVKFNNTEKYPITPFLHRYFPNYHPH